MKNIFPSHRTDPYDGDFALIETILWENGAYFLLDLHIERLETSAAHFSFSVNKTHIIDALNTSSISFDPAEKYRVRLLLDRSGKSNITSDILEQVPGQTVKIAVSNERTDRDDVFLHHKTTNRGLYDTELAKYREKGFFDVVFLNREGEITEGAITNIVVQKGQDYWTPPLSCGLLNGVYRHYLLTTGKLPLKEKTLRREDLVNADRIFLINSVRKMVPAILGQQEDL